MTCGIKKPNQPLRIGAGIAIIIAGIYFESYVGLLGIVPIVFALIGFCPLCYINSKIKK